MATKSTTSTGTTSRNEAVPSPPMTRNSSSNYANKTSNSTTHNNATNVTAAPTISTGRKGTPEKITVYLQHISQTLQRELDRLNALESSSSSSSTTTDAADTSSPPSHQQEEDDDDGDERGVLYVPLNAGGYMGGEMASYPQDVGACRPVRYADLGILYRLCDDARVDCRHMYLYRDPIEVVKSTTIRRKFNPDGVVSAMHLYTSMLYVIYSAVSTATDNDHNNRPRTVACTGLYEPNTTSASDVWIPIRDMFGWSGSSKQVTTFRKLIDRIYAPSVPLTAKQKEDLGFNQEPYYLQSLVNIHNKVVDLCRQQVRNMHHRS